MQFSFGLKNSAKILGVTSLVFFAACNSNDSTTTSTAPSSTLPTDSVDVVNAATDQMISIAANTDASVYAKLPLHRKPKTLFAKSVDAFLPTADANTSCTVAGGTTFDSSCSGTGPYLDTRTYNNCSLADGALTLAGTIDYHYSAAGCNLSNGLNQSVNRTVNLTLSGRIGGALTLSSATHTDYRGVTIGGGQTLTVGASAGVYTADVPGMHRVFTSNAGADFIDISTRTTASINAGGTTLANLTISGGQMEVIHNLAKYVLTLTANNIGFSSSCACPVSGSLTGTYSGSANGTATIVYTGCGTAVIADSSGDSANVAIDSCAY